MHFKEIEKLYNSYRVHTYMPFRCSIGLHKWSVWSDTFVQAGTDTRHMQAKVCIGCAMAVNRAVLDE